MLTLSTARHQSDIRRLFITDIVWVALLAPFWLPLVGALCILLKLLYPNEPVLFVQERVGYQGQTFKLLKFRTMVNGDTTKVTPFCACLRSTHLDELPQFWNIVQGDMVLVGPRPLTKPDCIRLGSTHRRFGDRFSLRPGLIGLEQILGRSEQQRRTVACVYVLAKQLQSRHGLRKFLIQGKYIAFTIIAMVERRGSKV